MTSLDIEKVIDGSRDEKEGGEREATLEAEELLRSASDSADSGENFEQL